VSLGAGYDGAWNDDMAAPSGGDSAGEASPKIPGSAWRAK